MNNKEVIEELNSLFGSYKAEWLKGKIFDLFAEPSYFPELKDNRPCVLQGGRGTGKTTVLRGLSYQGQYALYKSDIILFDKNQFIGLYHRVDTNRVRSFIGGGLDVQIWMKVFAHYYNLVTCRDVLNFLKWHHKIVSSDDELTDTVCTLILRSLNIQGNCNNQNELLDLLDLEIINFQAKVNNISDGDNLNLSMSGVPITILTEQVLLLRQFQNKIFLMLIDEYENFEDYQQQIINSLIKHTTENYTFKIGVRELGWRIKYTLNPDELLHDPADYKLMEIEKRLSETDFKEFAENVCQQRISKLYSIDEHSQIFDIDSALKRVSIEQEAELLKIENTDYYSDYKLLPANEFEQIANLSKLYLYFIAYWGKYHNMNLSESIKDYLSSKDDWDTRYNNYKYELLFQLRKGRGKRGIQKYYAGWKTFIKIAGGNIRYLMELIYRSYEKHLNDEQPLKAPISVENQTYAAQDVGLKNLMELEGLTKNGAQLTKLLLGFGRIFNVLASEEGKFAPERNQFSFGDSEVLLDECREIITAAVMNLALVRIPGNKLTDNAHTRDYQYAIHPIYAPFFVFSHRMKRKIIISQDDFLGVISKPKENIKLLLAKINSGQPMNIDESLPIQLKMFENYYNDKE